MNKKKIKILYALTLVGFLLPRIFFLGPDMSNSDALRWHNRSENFLNALKQGNFEETYQRYHPGVTLMWMGAASGQLLLSYQQNFSNEIKTYGNADFYPTAHGVSKILVVFVLAASFAFQLYLVRVLFGNKTSLVYGFFVVVEPYLIGINRWFHLSSMEAFFAFTSILSVLVYFKNKKSAFLVVSAVFGALGVLTKMTVFITAVYVFLLLIVSCVNKKINFKNLLIYTLVFVLSIFILFPALWVDFFGVVAKMYSALFNAVTSDPRGELLTTYAKIFYYPAVLIFKSSPLLIVAGIYALVWALKKGSSPEKVVSFYYLFILFVLSLANQKIDRYVVALFLPIILLVSNMLSSVDQKYVRLGIFFQAAFFVYITYCYYPVYSAYVNPLVGFRRVLSWGFYENSGEYYADSARFLNSKGRDIKVYIPNNVDSFKPYYKGKFTDNVAAADYIVYGLDFDRKFFPIFTGCRIEKFFGNRVYMPVAVYHCTSANLSYSVN